MEHPFCTPKGIPLKIYLISKPSTLKLAKFKKNLLGHTEGVHAAARVQRTLLYAIIRDSLPIQLYDAILSLKQPVSTHEDFLLSITNHMLSDRSKYSSKING